MKTLWTPLSREEVAYTKDCLQRLRNYNWAKKLEEKTLKLLKEVVQKNWKKEDESCLFEVRFANTLSKTGLKIENEYKTGIGKTDVDFLVIEENGRRWLFELTSMQESEETRKNTTSMKNPILGNTEFYSSLTRPFDSCNSPEIVELMKAQRVILSKIAKEKDKDGEIIPIKFPVPTENEYNIIVVDMRGFAVGHSDDGDYINILYGTAGFKNREDVEQYGRWVFNSETNERTPFVGIFDEKHRDKEKTRYLRECIHGVMFISEKKYVEGEIETIFKIFPNGKFFKNSSELENIFPLGKSHT